MKKSGKSGLGGYGHTIGGRIFITLFPAYAGVIPISERFVSSGSTLPRACGGDSSSSAHFTAVSGKPPTAPLPTLVVADVMCSCWNGRRRLAAAPSKADAGSPPWGPAPAFFMPGGGRTAREPYCRLVSSHVTPKLPRLFVRFRRIVPRSDTMRVVMHGYARKRHAKSQLGGIGGGVRPSWHRLAQPCIAVHFSLPQGVTFRENRDPSGTAESSRFGHRPASGMTCRVTSG